MRIGAAAGAHAATTAKGNPLEDGEQTRSQIDAVRRRRERGGASRRRVEGRLRASRGALGYRQKGSEEGGPDKKELETGCPQSNYFPPAPLANAAPKPSAPEACVRAHRLGGRLLPGSLRWLCVPCSALAGTLARTAAQTQTQTHPRPSPDAASGFGPLARERRDAPLASAAGVSASVVCLSRGARRETVR